MDLWKASQDVNVLPDLLRYQGLFFFRGPSSDPLLPPEEEDGGGQSAVGPLFYPQVSSKSQSRGVGLSEVLNIFIKLLL